DTGTSSLVSGDTLRIEGGTNGIDTILTGDTFTLNLDTTEIATTTFGNAADFVWTFNTSGGSDPTISFGASNFDVTANSSSFSGNLGVGTSSPAARLHVIGAGQAATNTAAPDAFVVQGGQGGLGTAGGGTGG